MTENWLARASGFKGWNINGSNKDQLYDILDQMFVYAQTVDVKNPYDKERSWAFCEQIWKWHVIPNCEY